MSVALTLIDLVDAWDVCRDVAGQRHWRDDGLLGRGRILGVQVRVGIRGVEGCEVGGMRDAEELGLLGE
jgi:hypothetical protein